MIAAAAFLLLAAQAQQAPLKVDSNPERSPGAVEDMNNLPNSRAARGTILEYGRCVVNASADKAAEVLSRDFTTLSYRTGLKNLSENNRGCFGRRGRMRASNLMFAAAVSEALLARDTTALNVRLTKAASGPAAPTFSPSDSLAMCTVRSAPNEVAALLATPVASDAETEAAKAVASVFALCGRGSQPVSTTVEGLRAIVATAAFRSITSGAQPATDN